MTTTLVPIVLWTQKGCGPCVAADAMLKSAGVHYVKIDVQHADSARVARWRVQGITGTPIIETGGLSFQGADPERIAALAYL